MGVFTLHHYINEKLGKVLELPPHGGHLISMEEGVHDGKNERAVSTGV